MKPGAREPPDNRKENGEGRGRVGATCRLRSAAARRLRRAGTAPRRRPTARPPLGPALRPRPSPLAAAAAVRAERSAAQRGGCGLRRSLRAAAEQGEPPRGQHRGRAGRARASARTSLRRGGPLAAPPQPLSPPRRRAERPGPRARQLSARSRPAPPRPRLASPRPGAAAPPRDRRRRASYFGPSRAAVRFAPGKALRHGRGAGRGRGRAGAAGFVLPGRTCEYRAGRPRKSVYETARRCGGGRTAAGGNMAGCAGRRRVALARRRP